ncbi:MAG: hypothetical protein HY541_00795 [Deltaproteobacteria bacterium]|nr:hypothetical protein [Deltaproteobacteria bacterium]
MSIIPSIADFVRDFVPSFPTAGPTAGMGGSLIPLDSYAPGPTPGDELGGVTGGGAPVSLELQKTKTSGTVSISGSISIGANADKISTEDFRKVIFDANHYPLTAKVNGVSALTECTSLGTRDGYAIVYQRTGGLKPFVYPRHYVIAMKVKEQTDNKIVIEWYEVKHTVDADGAFVGPYASTLNQHTDHVYTPYNHGSWTYDKANGKITYSLDSDAGGSLPSWMVSKDTLLAFPKELLKVKWGIEGEMVE